MQCWKYSMSDRVCSSSPIAHQVGTKSNLIFGHQPRMGQNYCPRENYFKMKPFKSIICSVCLLFYVLAASKVISGQVPSCDSAHSWRFYSAAPLGNQTASTMTRFPTHSHYPDTDPTSPCPILIMPSTLLGSDKYPFDKSLLWLDHGFEPMISSMRDQCSTDSATTPNLCAGNWRFGSQLSQINDL